MKRGKRFVEIEKLVDKEKTYMPKEAIELAKKMANAKFDESVELTLKLGVDPRHADQMVRGVAVLPHGTGKKVRVLAFAEGGEAEEAKKAGADFVGGKECIEKIQKGWLEFDKVVSTPAMMKEVSKLGKILGPRGMMPSPKTGTVSNKLGPVIQELKRGRLEFKVDKGGNLHLIIGKKSFPEEKLLENLGAVVKAVLKAKPTGLKGTYIQKAYLSTTMSPSIKLNLKELVELAR